MEIFRHDAVLGRVIAEREQQRVSHVRLEPNGLRKRDFLEQLQQVFPTMHAAPTNLTLGGKPLAMILCDLGGLAEGGGDLLRVARRICRPLVHAACGIDAHQPVRTDAERPQFAGDPA